MRILVTGASGYVGGFLIPRLLGDGHQVIAWGGPRWQPKMGHPALETAATNLGASSEALPDLGLLDAVVWLAQGPGYREFPDQALPLLSVNLLGLTRTLDLARRAGVRNFLYASTGNIYAPSLAAVSEDAPVEGNDAYALSKLAGEQICRLYQPWMAIQILRIFGIYGPNQQDKLVPNLIARVLQGRPVCLEPEVAGQTDEGMLWTPLHVRDAVAILARLLNEPRHETLNLASPEVVSIARVAQLAARQLGCAAKLEIAPRTRKRNLVADTARLQRRMPEMRYVPFAEGVAETVAALQRTATTAA
jgi:nucleoside-diphosphate-sugar epimerase